MDSDVGGAGVAAAAVSAGIGVKVAARTTVAVHRVEVVARGVGSLKIPATSALAPGDAAHRAVAVGAVDPIAAPMGRRPVMADTSDPFD